MSVPSHAGRLSAHIYALLLLTTVTTSVSNSLNVNTSSLTQRRRASFSDSCCVLFVTFE